MDQYIKKKLAKNWFKTLQEVLCKEIEELEVKKIKFKITNWDRSENKDEGGGQYRILENGRIFDKVGVNFSEVYGKFSNEFKNKIPGTKKSSKFWATGISVVMHMKNPHVPAMHFNTRYIVKKRNPYSAKLKINLQPSSAQLGPPASVLLKASYRPKYST